MTSLEITMPYGTFLYLPSCGTRMPRSVSCLMSLATVSGDVFASFALSSWSIFPARTFFGINMTELYSIWCFLNKELDTLGEFWRKNDRGIQNDRYPRVHMALSTRVKHRLTIFDYCCPMFCFGTERVMGWLSRMLWLLRWSWSRNATTPRGGLCSRQRSLPREEYICFGTPPYWLYYLRGRFLHILLELFFQNSQCGFPLWACRLLLHRRGLHRLRDRSYEDHLLLMDCWHISAGLATYLIFVPVFLRTSSTKNTNKPRPIPTSKTLSATVLLW